MSEQSLHDYRLDRIEADLARIADGVTSLAAITEKVEKHDRWLWDMEARVRVIETRVTESKSSIGAWERVAWLVVAAVIAAAVKWMPAPHYSQPPQTAALAVFRSTEEPKETKTVPRVE